MPSPQWVLTSVTTALALGLLLPAAPWHLCVGDHCLLRIDRGPELVAGSFFRNLFELFPEVFFVQRLIEEILLLHIFSSTSVFGFLGFALFCFVFCFFNLS